MNLEAIKQQAEEELRIERFREAVEAYKAKLRKAKWYHRIFPFKIVIIRRDNV